MPANFDRSRARKTKSASDEKAGDLATYRQKRSAEKTPEPFGKQAISRPRLFVVQKHAARRLHYDFRLEWGGTLRSWAVPKGPSYDTKEKRLAVQVEDHPVEYADFEGVIPEGNYGAGSVIVWDRGRWTPHGDFEEGLKKGKLVFTLEGYKLQGEWTLVRTKGRTRKNNEWLLIKHTDEWANAATHPPEESILSGFTVEELATAKVRAEAITETLTKLKVPKRRLRAADVKLMLAELHEKPFSDPAWIYELKIDGFRLLTEVTDKKPTLLYRRGSNATALYPDIAVALAALPFDHLVMDGEVTVLDEAGHSSFQKLQKRAELNRPLDIERAAVELPAVLYLFDLLAFGDFDLRGLPLIARKEILQRIVPRTGPLKFSDHIPERGVDFYDEVSRRGLEGIMAKRADSPYRAGRSDDWRKLRVERTDDFVVVGFSEPKGNRLGIGALHLARYEGDALVYAGRVGTGFSDKQLRELRPTLDAAKRKTPPCIGTLPTGKGHHFVNPSLVCEVRYREVTEDGLLRQPAFLRFRTDKPMQECVRKISPHHEQSPPENKPVKIPIEKKVNYTHLEKIFWPEEKYTKGDLIEYYRAVSPSLLPYLRDRPLVLTRYPDGIDGKSFFQKDAPGFVPDWIRTERMWSEHAQRDIDYFVCDDEESLLYLINLGTIPLHVWSSRIGALAHPDWCILDLDPKTAPFAHVIEVARAIHKLCDAIGWKNFVKTSGATGIHVMLPLGGLCTYDQSKTLGELLSRIIAAELPKIATTERVIAAREGRVYLDYLQNGHGKTIAGPYSARPVPHATVSTPLEWREVNAKLDPKRFTIRSLLSRLKKMKSDPLLAILDERPPLDKILEQLAKRI